MLQCIGYRAHEARGRDAPLDQQPIESEQDPSLNTSLHAAAALDRLRTALRESPPLVWSFLYFFFLLTGYYVLRPIRDAVAASNDPSAIFPRWVVDWFASHGIALGEYQVQVLFMGTFACMLLLQPLHGALVSRFRRRVFLPLMYVLFIACLLGFYVAFRAEMAGRGAVFFIWVAVFNLYAVSVFWSFMSDIYANDEARGLYGYIAAGGTLGGLLGPEITARLVERVGVSNMLLVSVGFLSLCIFCILKLGAWARLREQERSGRVDEEAMGGSVLEGLKRIVTDPLLRWMAVLMFFGVGVGTLLYNEQNSIVRAMTLGDPAAAEVATQFFSRLDRWINWLVLLIQVFVTRALMKRYGVAPLMLGPAVAILLGFTLLTASPLPMLVAMVQVMTRAAEFSLGKPARETIYTKVDAESRYKAKAAIDTVVYRGGDVVFAWVHKGFAAFGSHVVFLAGMGVAAGMTFGAWKVVREQRKLPAAPHVEGRAT